MASNNLWYRTLFGVVMCFSAHFGKLHWDWTRSVMYGFGIIGVMYVGGAIGDTARGRRGKGK